VCGVDLAPALLGHGQELEGHGLPGVARTSTFGGPGTGFTTAALLDGCFMPTSFSLLLPQLCHKRSQLE